MDTLKQEVFTFCEKLVVTVCERMARGIADEKAPAAAAELLSNVYAVNPDASRDVYGNRSMEVVEKVAVIINGLDNMEDLNIDIYESLMRVLPKILEFTNRELPDVAANAA